MKRRDSSAVVKDEYPGSNEGGSVNNNQSPVEKDYSDDWSGINSVGPLLTKGNPTCFTDKQQGYSDSFLLLREGERHLSTNVPFESDMLASGEVVQRGSNDIISIWAKCPISVKKLINQAGFTDFLDGLTDTKRDMKLVSGLPEWWWDTTNTFHLPVGEMTMTPLDFYMITGLSVGQGTPIAFDLSHSLTKEAITIALGTVPPLSTGFAIRPAWLKERLYSWRFDEHDAREVRQYARTLLLYTIGETIAANNGYYVGLWILPFLIRFDEIGNYDWGGMALATLYKSMSSLSRMERRSHVGFSFAWKVWALEVLGIEFWVLRDPMVDAWPRMKRWGESNRVLNSNDGRFSDVYDIRSYLNSLKKDQVRWRPWEKWRGQWGKSGERTAQRVLFHGENSCAFYLGERVIRQFLDSDNLRPPLPPPPQMRFTNKLTNSELLTYKKGVYFEYFLDTNTSYADFQAIYLMPPLITNPRNVAVSSPPRTPPPPPSSSPPAPPPCPCSAGVFKPTLPDYNIMYYDDMGIPHNETYPRLSSAAEMLPLPAAFRDQEFVSVPRCFLEEVAIHLGSVRAFCRVQLKQARFDDEVSVVDLTGAPSTSCEDQNPRTSRKRVKRG